MPGLMPRWPRLMRGLTTGLRNCWFWKGLMPWGWNWARAPAASPASATAAARYRLIALLLFGSGSSASGPSPHCCPGRATFPGPPAAGPPSAVAAGAAALPVRDAVDGGAPQQGDAQDALGRREQAGQEVIDADQRLGLDVD